MCGNQACYNREFFRTRERPVTETEPDMHYRTLGRTGWKVSEISFGAWAIGGAWGQVSDEDSMAALHQAIDSGVNFIDTADVYGNGRSERLIAKLKKDRGQNAEIIVATKAGRRLPGSRWRAIAAKILRDGSMTVCETFPPTPSTWSSFTARRRPSMTAPRSLGCLMTW